MKIYKIRLLSHAEPFQPFAIRLSNGQRLVIEHPEFLAIGPTEDVLVVFKPDGDFVIVQLDQITGLESQRRRQKAKAS